MADPGLPDTELVARARKGDGKAFGHLTERHLHMVEMLARSTIRNRADAEDAVQETFMRAFRTLDSLREAEKFGGWLYHIARRICLDHLRKKGRHDLVRLDDVPHAGVAQDEPAPTALEAQEERGKVSDAIARLPEDYRYVIVLFYSEKKSYKEIAEMLGEPDGTIANRIHRAKKMLKEAIGGNGASLDDEELEESSR